jgi:hypothetical protein
MTHDVSLGVNMLRTPAASLTAAKHSEARVKHRLHEKEEKELSVWLSENVLSV